MKVKELVAELLKMNQEAEAELIVDVGAMTYLYEVGAVADTSMLADEGGEYSLVAILSGEPK